MKTFLLGVGCQKGGTTWLHDYLVEHPECNLGFRKEYHVFDTRWLRDPSVEKFYFGAIDRLVTRASRNRSNFKKEGVAPDKDLQNSLLHMSILTDIEKYAEYFSHVHASNEATKLVGDITPSYSGLNSEHFKEIRQLLERHGFHVKVVFLMRDPVERTCCRGLGDS